MDRAGNNTLPNWRVAKTHEHDLIGYAEGVAGNSISHQANALSLTAGLCSANAEGGFGTPLSVAEGDPGAWSRHDQGFFPIRGTSPRMICSIEATPTKQIHPSQRLAWSSRTAKSTTTHAGRLDHSLSTRFTSPIEEPITSSTGDNS